MYELSPLAEMERRHFLRYHLDELHAGEIGYRDADVLAS
jgi:hypothetical protein